VKHSCYKTKKKKNEEERQKVEKPIYQSPPELKLKKKTKQNKINKSQIFFFSKWVRAFFHLT